MISLGYVFWGGKHHRDKFHFIYNIEGIHRQHDLLVLMLTLIIWLSESLSGFTAVKLLVFPPFLYCTLWKEVTMHNPHFRGWELRMPPDLEGIEY